MYNGEGKQQVTVHDDDSNSNNCNKNNNTNTNNNNIIIIYFMIEVVYTPITSDPYNSGTADYLLGY